MREYQVVVVVVVVIAWRCSVCVCVCEGICVVRGYEDFGWLGTKERFLIIPTTSSSKADLSSPKADLSSSKAHLALGGRDGQLSKFTKYRGTLPTYLYLRK